MDSNETSSIFKKYTIFIEHDTLATTVVCYGIASIGLLGALYKIRPFTKLRRPSDIPRHFIQKQISLRGTVKRIEPSDGTLLMVDHHPLLPLPRFSHKNYLPVKLAGIDVTANGISWLQTIINNKKIVFIPINQKEKHVDCVVKLQDGKECLNIAEELVKLGFGIVNRSTTNLTNEKYASAYEKSLYKAQKWAQYRRNGYWHFARHPTFLWKLQILCNKKLESVLPMFVVKKLGL